MVDLAGLEVGGISIGGIETCIDVPQYKLAFDIGRCPASALARPTILFTHAHIDHMGGVAMHAATRALRGMAAPTYVVPRENARDFEVMFDAWRVLDRSKLTHELVPLGPGEEHILPNKLRARPFRSPHSAPCQGYCLWSTRQKLLPEYKDLAREEIRRLRVDEGVEVTGSVDLPELAFTGDAKIEIVEQEECVRKARRLVIEATFIDDRVSVEQARSTGHIHLYELAERADLFENEAILLTHFSSRYKRQEILAALDLVLPAHLRARVTPLLTGW